MRDDNKIFASLQADMLIKDAKQFATFCSLKDNKVNSAEMLVSGNNLYRYGYNLAIDKLLARISSVKELSQNTQEMVMRNIQERSIIADSVLSKSDKDSDALLEKNACDIIFNYYEPINCEENVMGD